MKMGTADQMVKIHRLAMKNQKKDLLEAIEDMPMDAEKFRTKGQTNTRMLNLMCLMTAQKIK